MKLIAIYLDSEGKEYDRIVNNYQDRQPIKLTKRLKINPNFELIEVFVDNDTIIATIINKDL